MDKIIIAGREDKGTKYCILENDGVGLCVCKHRPCEQLQRKEQECAEWEKLANEANERANNYAKDTGKLQEDVRYYKELSKDFDTKLKLAHQDFTDFIQKQKLKISELETELQRLKKQYNCYACDSCGGKEDYINMKRHTENAIKTVHKYSQALQEIREIAKEQLQNVSDRCINTTPMYIVHKHIIEKINEVIGEK